MRESDVIEQLREIRDLLTAQQKRLDELHSSQTPRGLFGTSHLRTLLILAAIVLAIGSFVAYQYYRVLQSIIDQTPS